MQVVFCGTGWFPVVDAIREKLPKGYVVRIRDIARPLVEEVKDAQVILPSNAVIGREAIEAARSLILIQQPAVGHEGIDLEAAKTRGIPVCNAPGTNSASVAEAAMLLLLACARRYRVAERSFAAATIGTPLGIELEHKTLGLVGLGQSGARVERAALALGMKVLPVRSTSTREDFEAMLSVSDFVSIHCPLNARTRGMFDARAFRAMKTGAFLINCARGAIVDRGAFEEALASGRLGGAGLDVFWQEPWDPLDPLYTREDVITLPHIAGSTTDSFERIAAIVAENVRRIASGEELIHRIA
jgi:D-3-phosphoglycerate dehydrogenase